MKKILNKAVSMLVAVSLTVGLVNVPVYAGISATTPIKTTTNGQVLAKPHYTVAKVNEKTTADEEKRKKVNDLKKQCKQWIDLLLSKKENKKYLTSKDKKYLKSLKVKINDITYKDADGFGTAYGEIIDIRNQLYLFQNVISINESINELKQKANSSDKKHLDNLKKQLNNNKLNGAIKEKVSKQLKAYKKSKSILSTTKKLLKNKNITKTEIQVLKKLQKEIKKNKWNIGKVNKAENAVKTLSTVKKLLKKKGTNKAWLKKEKNKLVKLLKRGKSINEVTSEINMYNKYGKVGVDYMNAIYNSKYNKNGNKRYVKKSDIWNLCKNLGEGGNAGYISKSEMKEYAHFYIDDMKTGRTNPFELEQETCYEEIKGFVHISNALQNIAKRHGYVKPEYKK